MSNHSKGIDQNEMKQSSVDMIKELRRQRDKVKRIRDREAEIAKERGVSAALAFRQSAKLHMVNYYENFTLGKIETLWVTLLLGIIFYSGVNAHTYFSGEFQMPEHLRTAQSQYSK